MIHLLMQLLQNHISMSNFQAQKVRSRFKGVYRCGKSVSGQWKSIIQHEGVQHYLGSYSSEIEAAKTYDSKARQLLGDRAICNLHPCGMENSDITNFAGSLNSPTRKVHRRNKVIAQKKKRAKHLKVPKIKFLGTDTALKLELDGNNSDSKVNKGESAKVSQVNLEDETEKIVENPIATSSGDIETELDCFRCLDFNSNSFDVWIDKFRNEADIFTQGGGILPLLEQMHNIPNIPNQTTVSATVLLL